jgi:hypothetical protein
LDEAKQKWPAVLSEGLLNKIIKAEGIISLAASLNVDTFSKKRYLSSFVCKTPFIWQFEER